MKFKVIVKTSAKESKITSYNKETNTYNVELKAKPIEGQANKELIKLFKKSLNLRVKISSGLTSKTKICSTVSEHTK